MLATTPLARIAVVLVLTAFMAAVMLVRIGNGEPQAPSAAAPIEQVSLARHAPGSAAHGRHDYRLRLAAAAASSDR